MVTCFHVARSQGTKIVVFPLQVVFKCKSSQRTIEQWVSDAANMFEAQYALLKKKKKKAEENITSVWMMCC